MIYDTLPNHLLKNVIRFYRRKVLGGTNLALPHHPTPPITFDEVDQTLQFIDAANSQDG